MSRCLIFEDQTGRADPSLAALTLYCKTVLEKHMTLEIFLAICQSERRQLYSSLHVTGGLCEGAMLRKNDIHGHRDIVSLQPCNSFLYAGRAVFTQSNHKPRRVWSICPHARPPASLSHGPTFLHGGDDLPISIARRLRSLSHQ